MYYKAYFQPHHLSHLKLSAEAQRDNLQQRDGRRLRQFVIIINQKGQPMELSQQQLKYIFEQHKIDFIKKLGSGGFGSVYLGNSISQEFLPLAVKCITRKQLNRKPSLQKYLAQEINSMYSLKHPHIVKLLKTFVDAQSIFLVMEYCEFGNLYAYQYALPDKVFRYPEAVNVFVQILRGLRAIHQQNIIHRDLKCENILLKKIPKTNNYICKIGDFGFAKELSENTKSQCGTPNFMAPEILAEKAYDKCVDVWSIGVILFNMLFMDYPFKGLNLLNDIENKCSEGYDLLRQLNPQIIKKKNKSLGEKELNVLKNFFSRVFVIDPAKRITIIEISKHPLFKDCQVFVQTENESTESTESVQEQHLFNLNKVQFIQMVQSAVKGKDILTPQNTLLMTYFFSKIILWILTSTLKELQFSQDSQFRALYFKKTQKVQSEYLRSKTQLEKLLSAKHAFGIAISSAQLNTPYQKFEFFKDHYRIFLGYIFSQVHSCAIKQKQRLKIKVLCCHTINRVFQDSSAKYLQVFQAWTKQNRGKSPFDFKLFASWIDSDSQENISKTISAINECFYAKK